MKLITFTPSAARQWQKLAEQTRKRIATRLDRFAGTGSGDIKRLRGRAGARLRIGDWRVIIDESETEIVVVAVGHRREVYD